MNFRAMGLMVVLGTSVLACNANAETGNSEERAITALEGAVQSDPGNAELWIHLGFARRKNNQLDRAAEAFEKAVSLNNRSQEALFMLGIIYEKQEKKDQALRIWKLYLGASTDPEKRSVAETHIRQLSQ